MTIFPAPYTAQRIRRTKTGNNALGQPIYADTPTSVPVHSWGPTSAVERYTAALAGRTVTEYKLAYPNKDFQSGDAVILDGVTYECDGDPADTTHGPFAPGFGGYTIGLRLVSDA